MRLVLVIFILLNSLFVLGQDNPTVTLPSLNGENKVGIRVIGFSDSENNLNSSMTIYYPTLDTSKRKARLHDIAPANELLVNKWKKQFNNMPEELGPDWTISYLENIYKQTDLNSYYYPDFIENKRFPTMIFLPGSGGVTSDYAFFLEQVASMGIVVIAVDTPKPEWGADKLIYNPCQKNYYRYEYSDEGIRGMLNEKYPNDGDYRAHLIDLILTSVEDDNLLNNIIDKDNIFVSGHSIGGHAAMASSKYKHKVKTYINLDGGIYREDISNFDKDAKMHIITALKIRTIEDTFTGEEIVKNLTPSDYVNSDGEFINSDFTGFWYGEERNTEFANSMTNLSMSFIESGMNHESFTNLPIYSQYAKEGTLFTGVTANIIGDPLSAEQTYLNLNKMIGEIVFQEL